MPLQPAISRALPRSGRGKRYSIYTLRAAQVGHEARSLVLFRSSRGRLLLEKLLPRRARPPLRFLVPAHELRHSRQLLSPLIHRITLFASSSPLMNFGILVSCSLRSFIASLSSTKSHDRPCRDPRFVVLRLDSMNTT